MSTAVWVGNPDAYTEMRGIPELVAAGYGRNVQGGHFPAVIWNAFMEPAHDFVPLVDWDRPAPPERANARLFLPGNECEARVVGSIEVPVEVDPNAPTTTLAEGAPPPETVPPATIPIIESVEVGTTIAPDNLDPLAPMPSLPASARLGPC